MHRDRPRSPPRRVPIASTPPIGRRPFTGRSRRPSHEHRVVLADGVREALAVDPEEFDARAEEEAEIVKQGLRDGAFDNHQSIVGFEYEFYAVADGRWSEESRAGEYAALRVPAVCWS